jgi:hypothetical protein
LQPGELTEVIGVSVTDDSESTGFKPVTLIPISTQPNLKRGKKGGAGATSGIHFESVLHRLGIAVFEKTLFAPPSGYDPSQAVVAAMHTGLRIRVSFDSISAAVFDVL